MMSHSSNLDPNQTLNEISVLFEIRTKLFSIWYYFKIEFENKTDLSAGYDMFEIHIFTKIFYLVQ